MVDISKCKLGICHDEILEQLSWLLSLFSVTLHAVKCKICFHLAVSTYSHFSFLSFDKLLLSRSFTCCGIMQIIRFDLPRVVKYR